MIIPIVCGEDKENTNKLSPNAKSVILIEAFTWEVIYEYNSHEN